ncbi:MAG: hypothetical protein SNJ73_07700, partial [Acetobacteraceae bacterium]
MRASSPATALADALDGAAIAFALAGFAWLGLVYLRMLVSPAPQEMREGALIVTTLALLDWRNPFAPEVMAQSGNLYGILYPLLVVPFAALFGPGLPVHRAVAGLAFLAAAALFHRALRRGGVDRLTALLATAAMLAGWLYWVGGTVRPDGVGVALMMAAYAIAAPDPAAPRRFALALAFSLAAMSAKIYFVFPAGVAAAYVFLFRSRALGIAFGLATLAGIVAVLGLLALLLPGYPVLVLGANLQAARYDVAHLLRQSRDWALFSLPLLAALLVAARHRATPPGFWSFAAACAAAALLLVLGGHPGAHLSYFFHLLSPPLAIAVLSAAARRGTALRAYRLALPVAMLASAPLYPLDPHRFTLAEARFAAAERLMAEARAPLTTTELAALAALEGIAPPETGHSEYLPEALEVAPPHLLGPLWLPRPLIARGIETLVDDVRAGIA